MWTAEDFPGADKVPWQLLIRARLVREVDAFVATTIVGEVARVASTDVAVRVATAASEALRQSPAKKVPGEVRIAAASAVADFIDICPPWPWPWPWPWPGPGPWPGPWPWADREGRWEQVGHPYESLVLQGALELLDTAGSGPLQEQLGGVLREVGRL